MSKKFDYKKEKSPVEIGVSGALSVLFSDCDTSSQKHINCITKSIQSQEDFTTNVVNFKNKKLKSLMVADSFGRLSKKYSRSDSNKLLCSDDDNFYIKQSSIFANRATRLLSCGSVLKFRFNLDGVSVSDPKLVGANFCRDRFCPQCAKRLSLKNYSNLSKVLSEVGSDYAMLLLTLTVRNCSGSELNSKIDDLFYAWHKLVNTKKWKSVVKGYFRALEITVNKNDKSYHPHFHCILIVNKSYFQKDYIKHSEWLDMWKKATGDDRINQVNIKRLKGSFDNAAEIEILKKSINEVSKYSVKDSDYIFADNDLTDYHIENLAVALKSRRLVQYGGILRDIFKRLKLVDAESSDLVNINHDIDNLSGVVAHLIVTLNWSSGCYKIVDIERRCSIDIQKDE